MYPVYHDVGVAVSGVMMNPGIDGSDLSAVQLISFLILFGLTRECAITMDLKRHVFNLPV